MLREVNACHLKTEWCTNRVSCVVHSTCGSLGTQQHDSVSIDEQHAFVKMPPAVQRIKPVLVISLVRLFAAVVDS